MTLSGDSNYRGTTRIGAGALQVSGSITTTNFVIVSNTATLDLSGAITASSIQINVGGTLASCGAINGNLVNNVAVYSDSGSTLNNSSNVTDNGTMQFVNGSGLAVTGAFVDNSSDSVNFYRMAVAPRAFASVFVPSRKNPILGQHRRVFHGHFTPHSLTAVCSKFIMSNQEKTKLSRSRLFYPVASIALLVLTFIGFHYFYLQMQAFPGRPLTPPIRTLVITHGVLMTAWMLLAVLQPSLVAIGLKRVHMAIGRFAAVLAMGIIVAGFLVAVHAARVNPPDLKLFGLTPKEFLTVPLFALAAFAVLVVIGVLNRKRPDIHRPMMFMASLAAVSAALGRMPQLNDRLAGTLLEHVLSAFVTTVALGGLLLVIKCGVEKRFDGWFATAFGILTGFCLASAMAAKTEIWMQIATALVR